LIVWPHKDKDGKNVFTIVDGHNRYLICRKYQLDYPVKKIEFEDIEQAMLWAIDNQKGRRNLTPQRKIKLGYKRAALLEARARKNQGIRTDLNLNSDKSYKPVDTIQIAADVAGASRDTASKYRQVMKKASEKLKSDVDNNVVSIHAAYQEIKPKKQTLSLKEKEDRKGDLYRLEMMVVDELVDTAKKQLARTKDINLKIEKLYAIIRKLSMWKNDLESKVSREGLEPEMIKILDLPPVVQDTLSNIDLYFDDILSDFDESMQHQLVNESIKRLRDRAIRYDQEAAI